MTEKSCTRWPYRISLFLRSNSEIFGYPCKKAPTSTDIWKHRWNIDVQAHCLTLEAVVRSRAETFLRDLHWKTLQRLEQIVYCVDTRRKKEQEGNHKEQGRHINVIFGMPNARVRMGHNYIIRAGLGVHEGMLGPIHPLTPRQACLCGSGVSRMIVPPTAIRCGVLP